jgi:hypothetical protein
MYSQTCVQWPHSVPPNCGRFLLEVHLCYKLLQRDPKKWLLWAGGHYSEVVVSSGLTVLFQS